MPEQSHHKKIDGEIYYWKEKIIGLLNKENIPKILWINEYGKDDEEKYLNAIRYIKRELDILTDRQSNNIWRDWNKNFREYFPDE